MTTISGASKYMNAAVLANRKGVAAVAPTVLGDSGSTTSLLDAGRRSSNGIGLSARSRALTNSFISQSSSAFNQIHSLSISASGTTFALQQSILALRASLPASRVSHSAASFGDETPAKGSKVDTKA